jgi:hypothetical protein
LEIVMQLCGFRSKVAILGALIIVALSHLAAFAQSGSTGGSIGDGERSLSGPRNETERPVEEAPRSSPQQDSGNFDGAWTFTSAGCSHTGTLPAVITGGKIVIRGGSGQVSPDGTLHSVGAGNGMTLSAVGRLSGNTGAGTFNRSDGCVGSWIAIKQ